jgi:hypothetical protein
MNNFSPQKKRKLRNEIRAFARQVDLSGGFRKTEEGNIHWRSKKLKNSPRLHIRISESRGTIRWFAGVELADLGLFIQQKETVGYSTLTEAANSARHRAVEAANSLSLYSRRF